MSEWRARRNEARAPGEVARRSGLVPDEGEIVVGDVRGVVLGLHPASIEVMDDEGASVHLTNSQVFRTMPRVERGDKPRVQR